MATRCLGFATLMLIASILILGISAQSECGGDYSGINKECRSYISKFGPKIPPSEACCAALKGVDVSCYCKYVTPIVAQTCQVPNIPTDKCGSYEIPHSPPQKA
ncbi:unnamed protein product [Trifolium pratense]|uniref:Uncharacterized protein n=1 Tax=Trifolium pratense TaxID=57577 RepID=A0ACB0LXE5_TRIPR|nr:unnamed protein product [Trifolium pratense]